MGAGVRKLTLEDQAPNCEIFINTSLYKLEELTAGKNVVDIGCGYGKHRTVVEAAGGKWTGVEPFEGGAHTVVGDAENLPFENNVFDVVIMDAVLEHIPDAAKAISEVSRVLKPGGIFIGYVAFMECFHEISYSHLSFKALEHFSNKNDMKLVKIAGGGRFGIDYHMRVLFYPLPFNFLRGFVAWQIRTCIKLKSWVAYLGLRVKRKMNHNDAVAKAKLYFKVECLRQSNGFQYIIVKNSNLFQQ
ncbi:MAG: class I SAM-dependent methyltransferase [Bacteroidia bacterium]|nr:class I SAM-dependent methyltransferase [Bacteroidia bacterium]